MLLNCSFFVIELCFELFDLCLDIINLGYFDMKLLLNRLDLFVENLNLIVDLVDIRLDLDRIPGLWQCPFKFIYLSVQLCLFFLPDLGGGQQMLLLTDPLLQKFSRKTFTVVGSSQLLNLSFKKVDFSMDFFLMIIKSSDFFSYLIFLSHFFSHHSRILSVDFSAIFFTLVYIPDYHPLLVEDCVSLGLQSFSFSFQLLKALSMLFLVRFFQ